MRHKQASVDKRFILFKKILKGLYSQKILPEHSRTLTERSTPFSDTCLNFLVIFSKIAIIFFGRNTPNNKFIDVTNKEIKQSNVTPLLKSVYYELRAINICLEGAAFSVITSFLYI